MKAIFIDAKAREVKEVEIGEDNVLQEWYKILGVRMVEVALNLDNHNSIIVDEEGLLKPMHSFFEYKGGHQPFAGSGLVVGVDDEGETIAPSISLEEVKEKVSFKDIYEVQREMNIEPQIDLI